jgi:hypothetical protein
MHRCQRLRTISALKMSTDLTTSKSLNWTDSSLPDSVRTELIRSEMEKWKAKAESAKAEMMAKSELEKANIIAKAESAKAEMMAKSELEKANIGWTLNSCEFVSY